MAIVKQVSFKEKEKDLYEYTTQWGNFSEYIKQLIKADKQGRPIGVLQQTTVYSSNDDSNAGASFKLDAERDELEL